MIMATSSSHSDAARGHPIIKNPDAILNNSVQYLDWRARLLAAVAREGAKLVTMENPVENQYRVANDLDRLTHFQEYDMLQDKAKGILFERVRDHDFRVIRDCSSFLHMLEELDERHLTDNHVGAVAARTRLQRLRYDQKSDFKKFIHLFEARLDEAVLAGNDMSEYNKMYQLTSAIGPTYVPILREMSNDPPIHQTFPLFVKKVLECHELNHLFSDIAMQPGQDSSNERRSHKTDKTSSPNNGSNPKSPNPKFPSPRCYGCNQYGHKRPQCPLLDGKRAQDHSTDNKKDKASSNSVPDWTKFLKKKPKDNETNANMVTILDENEEEYDIPLNYAIAVDEELISIFEPNYNDDYECEETEMLMDSGTGRHMVTEIKYLHNAKVLPTPIRVRCADNRILYTTHVGELYMNVKSRFDDSSFIILRQVLFVSGLRCCLLSEDSITDNDEYNLTFSSKFVDIFHVETKNIVFSGFKNNRSKWIPVQILLSTETNAMATQMNNTTHGTLSNADRAELWHRRIGHRSAEYLKRSIPIVEGIPDMHIKIDQFCQCKICSLAKSTRSSHKGSRTRPDRPLEIITTDILDPLAPSCIDDKNLIVAFTCPYTGYTKLRPIAHKNDVAWEFATYHKTLSTKFNQFPVTEVRTDNALEYISGEFLDYTKMAGIETDSGKPYSSELNGISERKNRTVLEILRCLLLDAGMPPTFWPYALPTAEYILNRVYTKSNSNGLSPYESLYGKKPNLSNLRVFGSLVHVHLNKETRQRIQAKDHSHLIKLGAQAKEAILIGFDKTGYSLLDPVTNTVFPSGDITVFENENYKIVMERFKITWDSDLTPSPVKKKDKRKSTIQNQKIVTMLFLNLRLKSFIMTIFMLTLFLISVIRVFELPLHNFRNMYRKITTMQSIALFGTTGSKQSNRNSPLITIMRHGQS